MVAVGCIKVPLMAVRGIVRFDGMVRKYISIEYLPIFTGDLI